MKRCQVAPVVALAVLVLAGCSNNDTVPTAVAVAPASSAGAAPQIPVFDPDNFDDPQPNPFFPLEPGMEWVYRSETEDGAERDVVVVTHEVKEILGIPCRVVHDTVELEDCGPVEVTIDWYAEDNNGNVWYFGEDSKELDCDGTVLSTEGSWEAGVDDAEPGIIMLADPHPGDAYDQEFAPGVAEDAAEVLAVDGRVRLSRLRRNVDGCVQTLEYSHLAPTVVEYKSYARGVGTVLEVAPDTGERVELVSFDRSQPGL